ncbi:MAG TPA: hypothetical protein VG206_10655 [Terriglobia bacterium]|nr:hypothetical protein [Terriglobia bacterium]
MNCHDRDVVSTRAWTGARRPLPETFETVAGDVENAPRAPTIL